MMTPLCWRASSNARDDLPLAVGPATTYMVLLIGFQFKRHKTHIAIAVEEEED